MKTRLDRIAKLMDDEIDEYLSENTNTRRDWHWYYYDSMNAIREDNWGEWLNDVARMRTDKINDILDLDTETFGDIWPT